MYHPDEIRHFQKSINTHFYLNSEEVKITSQSHSFVIYFQDHIKKNPFKSFSIDFIEKSKNYINLFNH